MKQYTHLVAYANRHSKENKMDRDLMAEAEAQYLWENIQEELPTSAQILEDLALKNMRNKFVSYLKDVFIILEHENIYSKTYNEMYHNLAKSN